MVTALAHHGSPSRQVIADVIPFGCFSSDAEQDEQAKTMRAPRHLMSSWLLWRKEPPPRHALPSRSVCTVAGRGSGKNGAALEPEVSYREEAVAMLGFDVDAVSGQDVAVVTDQECLVYMRRQF